MNGMSNYDLSGASISAKNIVIGDGATISSSQSRPEPDSDVGEHCFVCYPWTHKPAAEVLTERLASAGIPVWQDGRSVQGGDNWRAVTYEAIRLARSIVLLIAGQDDNRSWSEQRSELVLIRDVRLERPLTIVPVRLDGSEVPSIPIGDNESLADLHWVDLTADFETAVAAILQPLRAAHS